MSACLLCPGTVADGIMPFAGGTPMPMELEHPMGKLDVLMDVDVTNDVFEVRSAGLTRTARKLASGEVYVPKAIWEPVT